MGPYVDGLSQLAVTSFEVSVIKKKKKTLKADSKLKCIDHVQYIFMWMLYSILLQFMVSETQYQPPQTENKGF